MMKWRWLTIVAAAGIASPAAALDFPGVAPGPATVRYGDQHLILQNRVLRVGWHLSAARLDGLEAVDKLSKGSTTLRAAEAFTLVMPDGRRLSASALRPLGIPKIEKLPGNDRAVRLADRVPGFRAVLDLAAADNRIRVQWRATLRDGANYVCQEIDVLPGQAVLPREAELLRLPCGGAVVQGSVDGSPVVAGNFFLACEHPLARNRIEGGAIVCSLPRYGDWPADRPWSASAAIGVAPEGQLRRGFLYYLERQRARPYRPLVYYISWFDLAAPGLTIPDQRPCLEVVEAFGKELVRKRNVALDAFVFDDGWDNPRTPWQFHQGFPQGFAPIGKAASQLGAGIGTWISPWGGYGKLKLERLEAGAQEGFEINHGGFSLAGPKYYRWFREVCLRMIREYGIGYFKFDGVGAGSSASGPGAQYGPDLEALLRLLGDLRTARADVFINTTVGTWPSPYWLWYSDSVWRGGSDLGFRGQGSARQQWLTYRDAIGYDLRKRRGPLYPLNSLKFQSVFQGQLHDAVKLHTGDKDLIDDIHMAVSSGTQLQELFITTRLMSPAGWDALAEAIRWMRQNTDVLVDSHGVGGDPGGGEVYGYASWSPRLGILVLRNPSDQPASIAIDLQEAFELPQGAPRQYRLRAVWRDNASPAVTATAGQRHRFELQPFEVAVWEAAP